MSAGDTGEREIIIEKATADQAQTKMVFRGTPREKKRRTENMALRCQNERGKGASEMLGAPIKVEIGRFANVNPTSRRRRVGGEKQRAEQAFMNGAG
jgi:hypothetical protein